MKTPKFSKSVEQKHIDFVLRIQKLGTLMSSILIENDEVVYITWGMV